jgi:RNA polymerase sigma factor (sigma-70 family)
MFGVHGTVGSTITTDADAADWLTELSRERGEWLLRCAFLLTREQETARDLVQDTLMQSWASRDKIARADDPTRYLLRIMLNRFRSDRRRRRAVQVPLDDLQPSVSDGHSRRDDLQVISGAIDGLPPRQRSVLVLRYFVDYNDDEIAQVLNCRPATVRSLAHRALKSIRSTLGEIDEY